MLLASSLLELLFSLLLTEDLFPDETQRGVPMDGKYSDFLIFVVGKMNELCPALQPNRADPFFAFPFTGPKLSQ
jgi:hypothetical protein